MMNRKMIITELEKRGYMAKSYDREKNGVILKGIEIVNDSNIVPVVYTDSLLRNAEKNNETMEEIVSKIFLPFPKPKLGRGSGGWLVSVPSQKEGTTQSSSSSNKMSIVF